MNNLKITSFLGSTDTHDKYVIEIPKEQPYNYMPSEETIQVAHDYVRITGRSFIEVSSDSKGNFPNRLNSNLLGYQTDVSIGIRDMIDIVLPYLNNHKYLQKEHIQDRIHYNDDEYFAQYGLDKPRYKKGDPSSSYTYQASIIKFYEDGKMMVNFRRVGEKTWEKLTVQSFELIKNTLQLCKSKWDLLRK